ncbi:hypothetical protein GON01_05180 [Sphingomonas sp. MAH-20]|jgi:hypothetical protein|uniref:Transcriptional regulator n=1 Tax=Sphingomonas horti TaxID=2682842 RepID=A0A6I4IYL0_9SPHN|nr:MULTISPECIES: hypothetical protein [Sphingomonas]MBA2918363.1 hypothetical protein [Sphingomonas sp. CGMCC 1.13658]MVO77330.1 hypothetical protein [Sphingomonas horti]
MADDSAINRFMRSAFGSIWSLELLLLLRSKPEHCWTRQELNESLRASEQVLTKSTADLVAAGLVSVDAEGCAQYAPSSPALQETVDAVAAFYASRPAAVRRLIVGGTADSVVNFADAFRFRRDQGE